MAYLGVDTLAHLLLGRLQLHLLLNGVALLRDARGLDELCNPTSQADSGELIIYSVAMIIDSCRRLKPTQLTMVVKLRTWELERRLLNTALALQVLALVTPVPGHGHGVAVGLDVHQQLRVRRRDVMRLVVTPFNRWEGIFQGTCLDPQAGRYYMERWSVTMTGEWRMVKHCTEGDKDRCCAYLHHVGAHHELLELGHGQARELLPLPLRHALLPLLIIVLACHHREGGPKSVP